MKLPSDRPKIPASIGKIASLDFPDRPREKAIERGVKSLTVAELLAIIIGSGLPGKSVIDLSREILAECNNSLSELARLSPQEMTTRFQGIGPAKAVAIASALELATRLNASPAPRTVVRSSSDAYNYIRHYIEDLPTEEFWIIILSKANVIKRAECISRGGTAATYVETKLVVKRALDNMASAIILAHNHPSGNLRPSVEDDRLTKRINDAAQLLDIKVLDHLIISSNGYYSYADESKL